MAVAVAVELSSAPVVMKKTVGAVVAVESGAREVENRDR